MKRFFYSVLAAATMLFATTSCSSEEEIVSGGTTQSGTTQKVKFSVQLPDQSESRAIAGGYNVGKGEMADKLIWALYESTKTDEDPVMTGVGEKVNGEKAFTADIDMVKGLEYKILFLAYNEAGTIFDIEDNDDLKSLSYKTDNDGNILVSSNVEAYDAFTACHTHKVNDEAVTTVTLYRPFAQINAATSDTDLAKAAKLNATVVKSELTLENVPTQYNVLEGIVSEYKSVTYTKSDILTQWVNGTPTNQNEELTIGEGTEAQKYNYLNMVYVLAGNGKSTSSTTNATFKFYRLSDNTPVRTIPIEFLPIQRNYRTNVIGDLLTQTESFKIVIDDKFDGNHNIYEGEEVPVATVNDIKEAIKNVKKGETTVIKFLQDIDANSTAVESKSTSAASITISQQEGVNLVIDGCGFKFDGTFYLEGNSRFNGTETLTFKNINFEHSEGDLDFISCDDGKTTSKRYAHNVTVENCIFTGNNNGAVVGMRYRQCYNMTVKNTTGTNLHSLMWASGGEGITFDNVTIENCSEGAVSFGTNKNVVVKNSEITLSNTVKYGISVDGDSGNSLVVENSTIEASVPVFIRKMTGNFEVKLEGANTLTPSGNYHVVFTNGGWDDALSTPTGAYTITGADDFNVYPREIIVSSFEEFKNALETTKSANIKFGENISGNATVLQKENVNIVIDGCEKQFDGVITVNGNARATGKETLTFKNINFSTTHATDTEESQWTFISAPSKIDGKYNYSHNVTIENCTFQNTVDVQRVGGASFTGTYNFVMKNCTATNMHSILQVQSCDNTVEVDNVETINCKNGVSFGNTAYPTIKNSTINAKVYGIRGDGDASRGNLVIYNTIVNAEKPVIIRKMTTDSCNVKLENADLNTEGKYDVVFTNGKDDESYTTPNGAYTITGADNYNVYPLTEEEGYIYNTSSVKQLDNILNNDKGYDVVLNENITANASETTANSGYGATGFVVTNGSVLDGNGKTITVNGANSTWDCVIAAKGGTIKNLTVSGAMRGIFMPGANADVYIDNVIFKNVIYTFNSDAGNKEYGVYISNSTINGWTSHSDVHKEVIYTNCKFGEGNGYAFCRPYGPTSFVNCAFEAGFEVDAIGQISFENCTIGGVALTAENLSTLVIANIVNATVK